jgi:hypothetical protein
MATSSEEGGKRSMNIVVRRGSRAKDKYRALGAVHRLKPEQIAMADGKFMSAFVRAEKPF